MRGETVEVTAMFSTKYGASCHTESFAVDSSLSDIITWANRLEADGGELIELICDIKRRSSAA